MSPLATSGAPPWAWSSYGAIAGLAWAAALAAAVLATHALVRRRRAAEGSAAAHAVVLAALGVAAGWWLAVALASDAPTRGVFCIAPSDWVATPPARCTAAWPSHLIAATLAWPVSLASAALGLAALLARRRVLGAITALALAASLAAHLLTGPDGLSLADLTSPGGIQPALTAALDLGLRATTALALAAALAAAAAATRRAGVTGAMGAR